MKKNNLIAVLTMLCLIAVLFLTTIQLTVFQRPFYRYEYQQNNVANTVAMENDALFHTTDHLLDYIQGKEVSLVFDEVVNGQMRQVFNQKEIDHMVDVKALYLNAMIVRNCLAVFVLLALIYLIYHRFDAYIKAYHQAIIIYACIFMTLAFWILTDFSSFWTTFHHVFFRNDLWLLDPNTSILINMVPERFFFDMVLMILIVFIFLNGVLYIGMRGYSNYVKRRSL